jgi:HK97 family phage prohead protease
MPEIRSYKVSNIEIRDGTDGRSIAGYPVVFGKPSENLGGFVEYVDREAFQDVSFDNVYLLYGHEFNNVLARVDAGTLDIGVDDNGVYFRATLPNTTLANDVLENIRVGNIQGMSFGFTVAQDTWQTGTEVDVRTILKIDELFEITLTPIPAYQDTRVAIAQRDKLHKRTTESELQLIELNAIARELRGMK